MNDDVLLSAAFAQIKTISALRLQKSVTISETKKLTKNTTLLFNPLFD